MNNSAVPSTRQDVFKLIIIALAYFAAHQVAFLYPDAGKVLAAIWPAGGIGLASLLLSPRRQWPAILAVLFVAGNTANLLDGRPLFNSLGFMTANCLESLACAWLIIRWCGESITFFHIKEVVALFCAAALVNAATACIGATTAAIAQEASFWEFWFTWWVADGLGILIIGSFIITWNIFWKTPIRLHWNQMLEWGLFLALWIGASWLCFQPQIEGKFLSLQPYMLVILLAFAAIRLGPRGVTLALTLVSILAATSRGVSQGPFLLGGSNPTDRLLETQIYLAVIASPGLLLAASFAETQAAEKSSREDQARIRTLGDNLHNGMVYQVMRDIDGKMHFVYISAGIEKLMGITAEKVLQDPMALYGLIYEEDQSLVYAAEAESIKNRIPFTVEVRMRKVDGQIRWMHLTSTPRLLSDGRLIWDGIQTDINERKQAEEQITHLLERFNLAAHAAHLGVWDWDIVHDKLDWDERMYELYGINREPFQGAYDAWLSDLHPEDRASSDEISQEALRGEREYDTEFRVIWPNGSVHWLKSYGQVIRDADGKPLRMIGVNFDITGQKDNEIKIRQQANRLKILSDASQVFATMSQDYQGVLDQIVRCISTVLADMGQIRLLSDNGLLLELAAEYSQDPRCSEALRVMGYSAMESIDDPGMATHVLSTGKPAFVPVITVDQVRASLPPEYFKIYAPFLPHSYILVPLRIQGSIIGVLSLTRYKEEQPAFTEDDLSLAQDLAERAALAISNARLVKEADESRKVLLNVVEDQKLAEGKLSRLNAELEQRVHERTAELESANKELEAFSYSVSHDLRAPLRGIDGWSAVLLDEYSHQLDEKGRQSLGRVRSETQRMGQLIDDLLRLSRVTRVEMKRGLVNLSEIARMVAARLQESDVQRPVDFIIQPGLTDVGDPNLLEIVLTNLLSNAYKFTTRQPQARIEFGRELIEGNEAYFIRDNGAGFDMTYAKNLFGAFQRMHKQSDFPGTGIGLATVQRIIHRHGGRVWAEAKKNQGATFYFTLQETA